MNLPIPFVVFTTALIVFCMLADLFLQHVARLANPVYRMLLIFGAFFIIQHIFYPPKPLAVEDLASTVAVEQVSVCKNVDYASTYISGNNCSNAAQNNIEVNTHWGKVAFSGWDATISSLEFSRVGQRQLDRPLFTTTSKLPDIVPMFLVGAGSQIITKYECEGVTEAPEAFTVTYKADFEKNSTIRKTFIVDKNLHRIDLQIQIKSEHDKDCALPIHIFFPAPTLYAPHGESGDTAEFSSAVKEQLSAVVISEDNRFEQTLRDPLVSTKQIWKHPALFGMDTRYIVYAMLKDKNNFVQNASFLFNNISGMTAVLEGSMSTKQASWSFSFYVGPKETKALNQVDVRLDKTLNNYWWPFGPFMRFLLSVVNMLFSILGSYGWAIVVLTLLFNLLLLPLTVDNSVAVKKQEEQAKKMAYIKQKYKNDPEVLKREQASLMMDSFSGGAIGKGIGTILQTGIFLTCNRLFANAVEMHGSSWLWISDLSASDPYYVLPIAVIILGLARVILLSDRKQSSSVIVTGLVFGLVFGVVMVYFSAGTVLYVATNTLAALLLTPVIKMLKK